MARGGRRKGTPGVAYSNRTDLLTDRAPQSGIATAASAGIKAPTPRTAQGAPPRPASYVDDTPFLTDPSAEPDQPITAGLPSGPGPGPEALQSRVPTTNQRILKYLPEFERIAAQDDTPDTFKALVTYLAGER